MARKIALIYGWDYGPAPLGADWEMGVDVLQPAINATELHVRSLMALSEVIAEHPDARLRRSVLSVIQKNHPDLTTMGEILSVLKRKRRPVEEMLDALLESRHIEQFEVSEGRGTAYALREDDEPSPIRREEAQAGQTATDWCS